MSKKEEDKIYYYAGKYGLYLTMLYYITSTNSFLKIKANSKNNLEHVKFYKILFNYTASFISYFYADLSYYEEMSYTNLLAILFNLSFLIVYVIFEIKIDIVDTILNILMISITSLTYFHYFYEILVDEFIFGLYFMGSNLLVLIHLVYDNYTGYKTKSNSIFNFLTNIFFTLTAICWFIYAIYKKDFYMKILFGIEIFSGLVLILGNKLFSKIFENKKEGFKDITNEELINNQNLNMNNTIEFEENKPKKYENI